MSFAMTAGALVMGSLTAYQIQQQNEAIQNQQQAVAATTKMNMALKAQEELEVKQAAGLEKTGEAIKRFEERGRIQAAQGESGVAGVSPLRELANSYLQEALTQGSITAKAEAQQRSIALQNQSIYLQGLSELNRLDAQYTSGFDAALKIGISAGAGALAGGAIGASAGAGTFTSAATGNVVGTTGTMTGAQIGAAQAGVQAGVLNFTSAGLVGGMSAGTQLGLATSLYGMSSAY